MRNCKVIAREQVFFKHRLFVLDLVVVGTRQQKGNQGKRRLKTWKLRSGESKTRFKEAVDDVTVEGTTAAEKLTFLEKKLMESAEKMFIRSKGFRKQREKCWWDDQFANMLEENNETAKGGRK